MEDMAASVSGKNAIEIISFIFANNVKAGLISILLGLLFGIIPFLALLSNGYLLGFVSRTVSENFGIGAMWRILPHGTFELPAIILSASIGIKLGTDLFRKKRKPILDNLKIALKTFFYLIMPLLVIAAIIEGLLIALLS